MPQPDYSRTTNEPSNEPWVEIIEQPNPKSTRFRYESENSQGGILCGANSTKQKVQYPAIKVHHHKGPCVVVVSLVTTDDPKPKPHPHSLVGQDCKQEVCTKKVKTNVDNIIFSGLGIQCKRKNQIDKSLTLRKQIRVDPFRTGFDHMQKPHVNEIDLSQVRLCFQVFLPDKTGKYQRPLQPVCSEIIYDKKGVSELLISDFLPGSSPVEGTGHMIILTGKLPKADDLEVVFYEGKYESPLWTALGSFQNKDIHQSVAVKVKIPPYNRPENPRERIHVHIVLRKKSTRETSESKKFIYYASGNLAADRSRKRNHDGFTADSKRVKYDSDANDEEEADNVPAVVMEASFPSGSSAFTSGEQSLNEPAAAQYTPQQDQMYAFPDGYYQQMPGPNQNVVAQTSYITGQDQFISVRSSDIQLIQNEHGTYMVKPGPTAGNQMAQERDLAELNLDNAELERLVQDFRDKPDGEFLVSAQFSDILKSFNVPSDNFAAQNEVLVLSSGESSSLTREIRDIAPQIDVSAYNQTS